MTRVAKKTKSKRTKIDKKKLVVVCFLILCVVSIIVGIMLFVLVYLPAKKIENSVDEKISEAYSEISYCMNKEVVYDKKTDDWYNPIDIAVSSSGKGMKRYGHYLKIRCDEDSYVTMSLYIDKKSAPSVIPEPEIRRTFFETDTAIESAIPGAKARIIPTNYHDFKEVVILEGNDWSAFDKNYRKLLLDRIETARNVRARTFSRIFVLMLKPGSSYDLDRLYIMISDIMRYSDALSKMEDYEDIFVDGSFYYCDDGDSGSWPHRCSIMPMDINESDAGRLIHRFN